MGLFAEKRLFIFRGNREKEKKRGKKSDDTHPLISLLENLPDETFVVVDGPRNEDELGKYLLLRSDVRMFDDVWSEEVWHHRYPSLDTTLIREIIKRYRMSVTEDSAEKRDTSHEIHLALEKLSLLSLSKQIETQDIDETMGMSAGAKTFDLVDAVMRGDASRALRLFRIIIREETSDRFLPSFIGLMRNSVYTRFLREKEIHESEIVRTLGAHPFVVQKALGSRIDWSTLRDFYDKLIDVNIASRSGR